MKFLLSVLLVLACAAASAAEPAATMQAPLREPWVPPDVARRAQPAPETRGEALRAQVRAKLRQRFDAADGARRGSLSIDEARAANWGWAVANFERIDVRRAGRVDFHDVLRHLRARGADL